MKIRSITCFCNPNTKSSLKTLGTSRELARFLPA